MCWRPGLPQEISPDWDLLQRKLALEGVDRPRRRGIGASICLGIVLTGQMVSSESATTTTKYMRLVCDRNDVPAHRDHLKCVREAKQSERGARFKAISDVRCVMRRLVWTSAQGCRDFLTNSSCKRPFVLLKVYAPCICNKLDDCRFPAQVTVALLPVQTPTTRPVAGIENGNLPEAKVKEVISRDKDLSLQDLAAAGADWWLIRRCACWSANTHVTTHSTSEDLKLLYVGWLGRLHLPHGILGPSR